MFGRLFSFTDAVNISAYTASIVGRLVNHKLERDTWRSLMNMVINIWGPWKMRNLTDSHATCTDTTPAPWQAKHAQRGGKGTGKAVPIFDPGPSIPGKDSRQSLYMRLDGFGGLSWWTQKSRPPPSFKTRTGHAVTSSYTELLRLPLASEDRITFI